MIRERLIDAVELESAGVPADIAAIVASVAVVGGTYYAFGFRESIGRMDRLMHVRGRVDDCVISRRWRRTKQRWDYEAVPIAELVAVATSAIIRPNCAV